MNRSTVLRLAIGCIVFLLATVNTNILRAQNTLDLAGLSSSSPSKVAYSLRRLSSSYSGNLIQVRRSSDNATSSIGYDGSGNLDVSALTAFVGSGDGFISIWYDQSGNGNHAMQGTTSLQPQIVSSGTVLTSGSRPTIKFNGSTYIDGGTTGYSITGAHTLSAVYNFQSGTVQHIIDRVLTGGGNPLTSITGNNQGQYRNDAGSLLTVGSTQSPPFSNTFTATWDASNNINHYKNGVSDYTGSLSLPATLDIMRIGMHFSITGTAVLNIWEVILFPSSISTSERKAMECNQQVYYGITTMPAAITGNTTLSTAITTTLADATSSGTWSSVSTGVATIGTSGVVTGVSAGTSVISYTMASGCAATTTVTVNTPANALNFDGTNDFVAVANNSAFETSTGTIEMWIRPNWVSGSRSGNPCFVSMRPTTLSNTRYSYHINNNLSGLGLWNGSSYQAVSFTFTQGTWYHVALVYSTTSTAVYINGTLIGSTSNGIQAVAGNEFRVGMADNGFFNEAWLGNIDEVRVWNTTRTQTQIQANMNCDIAQQTGLVAYYRFNQGAAAGTNTGLTGAFDYSGNGYCGTLTNFSLTGSSSNYVTGAVGNCNTISDATPVAFSGNTPVCTGSTITLGNANTGGTWSTASGNITINSTSGLVTGVTAGTATVTYTLSCNTSTLVVTINATPVVAAITGNTTLSTTIRTTLADATASGVWTSAATGVATIGSSTGVVSGVSAGTALISYTVTTSGCSTTVTTNVTVKTPNNALNLDGSSDYVSISGSTGIPSGNGQYTIEAWIKPTAGGVYGIAGWGNYGTNNQVTAFRLHNSTTLHHYWWFNDLSATVPNLVDGNWHHVACTYNGTTRAIYCDGALVASDVPSGHNVTVTNNVNVGRTNNTEYFPGGLDEVRIWNVGRTQSQIQADMNCDVSQQAGLVAYYRFDQGTASGTNTGLTCAYDYSGNANTGTLNTFGLSGSSSNYVSGAVGTCNTATPIAPGTFSGNTPVCVGSNITLSNANAGGIWSTASGNVTVNSTSGVVTGVISGTTATVNYTLNCSTSSVTVTVNPEPAITSVNPLVGYPGSSVTIVGTNFDATTTSNIVYFGATRATVTAATTTTLTVTVPTGATFAPVTVETTGCGLIGYSQYPYLPSYNNSAFVANKVNLHSGFTLATTSNPRLLAIGDIDGDGKADLVVANNSGGANSVSVFRNISTSGSLSAGSFAAKVDFAVGTTPLGVAIADLDGDGKPEVLTANQASSNFTVLRNTSTSGTINSGSFAAAVNFTANAGPATVGVGDIDMDGKTDVIIANNSAGNVSVYRNTSTSGSISFATKVDFTTAANSYHTPIIDIDGDGKPDMVVANAGGSSISVFRNTSTPGTITSGSFASKVDFSVSVPWGFAVGDIDGDGKPDFVASKNGSAQVAVLRNTSTSGSVTFAAEVTFTCGGNPQSVALGDIDGDGKLDIISSSNSANMISVFRNTATSGTITSGSLAAKVDFRVGSAPEGVSIGDLDGDGLADVVVASGGSGSMTILRNNPLSPISGTTSVCVGATTTLANATAGGTWVSGATGTATVNSTSGLVTGVAAGTAIISYVGTAAATYADNIVTINVTVNSQPTVAAITGTTTLTLYNTTTLANATSSGVWSSSATGVATVNSTSGIVTGVSEGTATISYTVTSSGCSQSATTNVTVSGYNGIILDGSNDYMITPDLWSSFSSGSASMTVDLWFKANAAGDVVVEKGAGGVGSGWHDTWIEVLGTGEVRVRVWSLSSVSLGFITFGTWHHAAIRYNGATNKLDGVLDGVASSSTVTGGWSRSGSALFLLFGVTDGTNLGSGAYLNGVIDEIRVWNRWLCDGEIANDMAGRVNGSPSGLVAHYTLDQGIGGGTNTGLTTAIDYSGNGRNATLVNFGTLTGTSSNWITGTVNALAPVFTAPTITASSNVTICNGTSTTLTASGGTSYQWSPSTGLSVTTGSSVTASPTSTITYTVTDICGGTSTVQVSVNPAPTVSGGANIAICIGSSTNLTASGASTYTWSPSATLSSSTGTTVTATPTVTTIYTVTGTNGLGCFSSASVTVTVDPYSNLYTVTGGGPYCSGGAGATIGLSNSDAGYNYQLYKGASTIGSPIAGTGAAISFGPQPLIGTYTVVATKASATACTNTMTGSTSVAILTSPATVTMTGGGSVCSGGPGVPVGLSASAVGIQYQLILGGSPVGSPTGGVGSGMNFGIFTTLGTYTATATNTVNGCVSTMSGTAIINAAAGIVAHSMTGGGSYCLGGAGVNIGLASSTNGISYQLFLGTVAMGSPVTGTGAAISFGLQTAAGTYTVVGTNTTTGCFGNMTGSVNVSIDPLPSIWAVTGGGSYCAGGSGLPIGLSLSDIGVDYQLYNGATPVGSAISGTGAALSFGPQTAAGTYTIIATDVLTTCSNSMGGSVAMSINPLPIVSAGTGVTICATYPTTLSATGALNYTWSPATALTATTGSSVTASPSATITYTATGTDINGCVNTGSVTVSVNPLPTITPSPDVAICTGSSTGLTASGAASYTWSPATALSASTGSSVTANPTTTITYTVEGTDLNSCVNTANITVTVNAIPTVSAGVNVAICTGSGTTLTGSGATTYSWTPAATLSASTGMSVTASPTVTTTYTVTGTSSGCSSNAMVTVSVNALPSYTASNNVTICAGNTTALTVSENTGNNALQFPGSGSNYLSIPGSGSVKLQTSTFTVSAWIRPNSLSHQLILFHGLGCSTWGSWSLGIGGSENLINAGKVVFGFRTSNGSPANYVVSPSNITTGSWTHVATTYDGSNLRLYLNGSLVTTTAASGTPYNSSDNLYVGMDPGCGGRNQFDGNLDDLQLWNVTMSPSDIATYYNQHIAASTSGIIGSWAFDELSGSTMTDSSSNANHGSMIGTVTRQIPSTAPIVSSSTSTYVWAPAGSLSSSTGTPVIATPTITTTYTVTGTNVNGCINTTTTTVSVNALPGVGAGSNVAICRGTSTTLSATGGVSYTWTPGTALSATVGSAVVASPTVTTTYTVTGTGSNGCTNTATVTVSVNALPTISAGSGTTICQNTTTTLSASGGITYSWTPATTLSASTGSSVIASPTVTTTYLVTGTDASGCSNTASVMVSVNPLPTDYAITGGGSFCSSTSGTAIGLASSDLNVNYQLYISGTTAVGSPVAGTGSAISFGLHTSSGIYTIVATNSISGCSRTLSGSTTLTSYTSPAIVAMIGGGSYCVGGTGVNVGLAASASGVNYQLYLGGSPVGSPVAGIGGTLSFGLQTVAGTYTVVATNVISGCTTNASGTAVVAVYPALTSYAVSGSGSFCSGGTGIIVSLSGSDVGVNYQLYRGGSPLVSTTIAGTGSVLNFGAQTTAGIYTVVATHASNGCTAGMSGSGVITVDPLPTSYSMTGGGNYCSGGTGVAIGLGNSDIGIDYQLYLGATPVGSTVAGTGSSISFGLLTTAGVYTVTATNSSTGCTNNMTGSSTVIINPLPTIYTVSGGGSYCSGAGIHIYLSGSNAMINYQLYNGGSPVGIPLPGTGAGLDFGAYTTPGTYTVVATNSITSCTSNMTGSGTIVGVSLPAIYTVTGGGSYCAGGSGVTVSLSNSDIGINYQLYRGASTVGSSVAGNGSAINFGSQTIAGTYTIVGTNATLGCTSTMSGSAVVSVNPVPAAVSMIGGGSYCIGGAGVSIGLSGSAVGIDYQLYLGGSPVGSPVPGIGGTFNFGTYTTAGIYTATAINSTTSCTNSMTGSVTVSINALPTAYTVTGGGTYCVGGTGFAIGMSGSQSGVNYQLFNGGSPVGAAVAGSGSAFSFGVQTAAGTYTVVATNASTSCTNNMSGSAAIIVNSLPAVYSVTGGGPYCAGGSGATIGLSNSDLGINYQLYNGSSPVSAVISGSGTAITFGSYTVGTTYTAIATDATTGCTRNMSGSATVSISSLPAAVPVTGGGTICISGTGVAIGLSASAIGVDYQLYVGATPVGSPVSGVGGPLSFGLQTTIGTYTVVGTKVSTGCTNNMSGSAVINNYPPPTAFTVTGTGSYCSGGTGVAVGMTGSATGTTYQLYRGATAVGSAVSGTGSAISFGLQTTVGTYTVVGTTIANGCTDNMTGSAIISIDPLPTAYTVTGGGSYCSGGSGVSISLANSDAGINYQLYRGATLVGSAVPGTGSVIGFGLQTVAGTYTVIATNISTTCTNNMTSSATVSVNPLPVAYTVTGGGSYCSGPGVHIFLINSDLGVNYQLYESGSPVGSPVAGTGTNIDFGAFTTLGTYTVTASNTTTGCNNNMTGSAIITGFALPTVYNVTGGGNYCSGGTGVGIGLSMSDIGVSYQLYNGASPVGSAVPGNGTVLNFGLQTAAGIYTVLGINTGSSCTQLMSGSATITITPPPASYTVTGGGSYCSGGTGIAVGLSSSDAGVNYQLYNGASAIGSPVAGSGTALNFGLQTASGTYTVIGTDGSTACPATMSGSAVISINSLPNIYAVTGGGSFCAGGTGVSVALSGSQSGVNYQLYNGSTASGSPVAGSGSSVTFGLQTNAGIYTAIATNATTTCTVNMAASATVSVNPLPTDYAFTGGGTFCAGGSGITIGIIGSDLGTSYQLYRTTLSAGTVAVGTPFAGTGSALSFGTHTITGVYTVFATNTVTGCSQTLSGNTTILTNAPPAIVSVLGGGSYCSGGTGVSISLAASAIGINYQLYLGATPVGSPVAGVGSGLSFGLQTTPGTYTVIATNPATGCTSTMSGSATVSIYSAISSFSVTGGGSYCSGSTGVTIGLSGSVTGVTYQLYRGGVPLVGTVVSGTGSAISFGTFTTIGTYTVLATNTSTSCTANMSGSVTISTNPLPAVYTITGGGSYCLGGSGVAIGLSNSSSGINYQLYRSTTAVGSPVAGTGSALNFGLNTTAGTYSVVATDATTGCTSNMTGSATVNINALPFVFTVGGGGSYCSGGTTGPSISLSGSTGTTTYQLYLGSTPVGSPVSGTGGGINFGTYTTVGTYSVTATSTLTGCTNAMSGNATISTIPLPIAYTVTGGGNYCTGSTGVTVGLSGSNTGISYQLYRGASMVGSAMAGTGAALNFGLQTTAGTYTVVATVIGTFCTSNMSGSATVGINTLPFAFSMTGGGSYCTGGTGVAVGLSSSVSGTDYQLYRNGSPVGSPVSGTGTTISFGLQTIAGSYTTTATNTITGCSANMSGTATVSINALPAIYTVTGGGGYCTGGAGVLVGLSGSQVGVNYQLYIGGTPTGSPVAGTGATINFGLKTTSGTYTVVATNTSTACTSNMSGSATVSINSLPSVYAVTGGGAYCSGGTGVSIGLSNSQTGVNYQLYRSAVAVGSPVSGTGSAISFGLQTITGSYSVTAVNSTTGCTANMSGSATVSINSAPTICSMSGGGAYCAGGTGVAVSLGASISGVNYQLYLGGTPTGSPVSGVGGVLNFGLQTAAGTYTAVATNASGCSSNMSGSAIVSINPLPSTFTVTGGGALCAGAAGVNISLSGSVSGTTYKLYQGPTPVTTAISGTGSSLNFGLYNSGGTYTVKATIASTGCTNTMSGSAIVTVNPIPTYTSTRYTVAPAGVITLNATPSGGNWSVLSSTIATIGSSDGIVNGVSLGSTYVTYTANGCASTHALFVTPTGFRASSDSSNTTTGISNTSQGESLHLSPNPTRGLFNIRGVVHVSGKGAALSITNMLGQIMYEVTVKVTNGEVNSNVSLPVDVPNGMYIVTLHTDEGAKVFHLVIEK